MSESVPRSRPQRLRWQALWQLHPPVALVVRASQGKCLQTLALATKPSTDRLHLRNLFMSGRRYYIQPQQDGFKLTSDNRLIWGGKRNRTRVAAVVFGKFSSPDNEITFIRLHSRVNVLHMLSGLLLPIFFTSIVVYMPWSHLTISLIILLLFGLSLIGRRFDAAFQVNEMVYFVQKALEDLPPVEVSALPASGPDVVLTDFREQWYRFYREQIEKNDL
jgi:hypothetical protein